MAPRKTKAQVSVSAPEGELASSRQTYALRLYTGKDYRGTGLTKQEASDLLSECAFKAHMAKLAKGVPVSVRFEADARRLFTALKGKGVRCALKGGSWVFTPPAVMSDPDGFPTR